jgi:hypothetical protein
MFILYYFINIYKIFLIRVLIKQMAQQIENSKLLWSPQNRFSVNLLDLGNKFPGLDSADITLEQFNAAIKTVTLPDLADQPLEDFIAGQWVYTRGRIENFLISITFQDFNGMALHRYFTKNFINMEKVYPSEQYFELLIMNGTGWGPKGNTSTNIAAHFKRCMLIGISGATFDNTAKDSIVEFSVTIKSGKFDESYLNQ